MTAENSTPSTIKCICSPKKDQTLFKQSGNFSIKKKTRKEQQDVHLVTFLSPQQHLPDWSSWLLVMVLFCNCRLLMIFAVAIYGSKTVSELHARFSGRSAGN